MKISRLIALASTSILVSSTAATGQACGCGESYVIVRNAEGFAVDSVVVEIVDPTTGMLQTSCSDGTPTRQIGNRHFKFTFGSSETRTDTLHLRVSAPGYLPVTRSGRFLGGCDQTTQIVLYRREE